MSEVAVPKKEVRAVEIFTEQDHARVRKATQEGWVEFRRDPICSNAGEALGYRVYLSRRL